METLKREAAARKEAENLNAENEKKIKSLQEELDLARKEIRQLKGQLKEAEDSGDQGGGVEEAEPDDSTTMTADEQGGATGSRANMVL